MVYVYMRDLNCFGESENKVELEPLFHYIKGGEIIEWDKDGGKPHPMVVALEKQMAELAVLDENVQPVASGAQTL